MKKKLLYLICSLFLILGSNQSFGQAFTATYTFVNSATTTGLTDPTPVPTAPGVTFGSFSAVLVQQTTTPVVAPATNPNAGGRFSFIDWPPGATTLVNTFTGSIDLNQYYQVTITPNTGIGVTLTNMTFTFQRSSTGVRQYSIRSSVDNYASNLPASITAGTTSAELSVVPTNIFQSTDNLTTAQDGSTITFDATAFANVTTPITLRFYGYNAEASGGTFSIDNVVINGLAATAVANPTLTATTTPATTPTSIDFGNTQTLGTTSTPKTFNLAGTNIPATGVTLVATPPYTISASSGGTYGSTLSFTQAQMASNQTVYVQFTPTVTSATPGTVIATAGAATATVALTGTGAPAVPTLTATPTTLSFGNVNAGLTSVKTYVLSGTNLTSSATVTATAPYTVSSDGIIFGSTATFTAASILAGTATVSVKFSPTAAVTSTSTITTSDVDVTTTPSVTVTGAGVVPVLTATTTPATSPTALDFGNQQVLTTASKTYSLSGVNLTGNTTVAVTGTGYTISKDGVTYATTSLTYTVAELTAPTAPFVYVRFSPGSTLATFPGTITNTTTGTGASVLSVSLTGASVAAPVPALTVTPTTLTGFSTFVGQTSVAQSYVLSGTNLSGNTTLTVTGPYSISKTTGGSYGNTLTYTVAELASAQTVFVKFTPTVVAVGDVNNGSVLNATSGTTNTQSVTLSGTGVGVPALTPTPSTLTFSAVNGSKAVQTFVLNSAYVTASTTLTATGPYLLSKDNTTFTATLAYTITEIALNPTVYVQFTAPATVGAANGSVAITSTGANSTTVTLNGTSLGTPLLSVTPTTALIFTLPSSATAVTSAAQTFTITGANITANTTVTATAPYLISKDGITYSSSLTFSATELAAPKQVYVTFTVNSTTSVGSTTSSIALASVGATNVNVSLVGNIINTVPTIAAVADQTVCYGVTQQSVQLTGITAGVETNQVVILSVSSSNPTLFSSIGVSPIISNAATLNYTVANGQSGTSVITLTVKDNGLTATGGIDTYTRTFNITVNPIPVITITIDQPNIVVERGSTATLTATGGGTGATYSWVSTVPGNIISPLSGQSITIRPNVFSTYTVTVSNACLTTSTTKSLGVEIRNASKLETSNVITPNGDGKNDVWVVRNIDLYTGNNVKVFDKAGKLVFSKTGYNNDWNGYYNGSPLPQGSYYYVVDLGQGIPYRGVLNVVRD